MINFTVYSADCVGNSGNCLYLNKNVVTDKESFIAATKMDHVTAKYKGNYRSKDNFEFSDCIPLDCDNDHSDNPDEWVTPFDVALEIPGVAFAVSYSRHHNLPKEYKSVRPRFHVFFPIPAVTDENEYATMKKKSQMRFLILIQMPWTVQDFFMAVILTMSRYMKAIRTSSTFWKRTILLTLMQVLSRCRKVRETVP